MTAKLISLLITLTLTLSMTAALADEAFLPEGLDELVGTWTNSGASDEEDFVTMQVNPDGTGKLTTLGGNGVRLTVTSDLNDADFNLYVGDAILDIFWTDEGLDLVVEGDEAESFTLDPGSAESVSAAGRLDVAPGLNLRYDPDLFTVTENPDGSHTLTCPDAPVLYCTVRRTEGKTLQAQVEEYAAQFAAYKPETDTGVFDFPEDQAALLSFELPEKDGVTERCCFLIIADGDGCYALEAHTCVSENMDEDDQEWIGDVMEDLLHTVRLVRE